MHLSAVSGQKYRIRFDRTQYFSSERCVRNIEFNMEPNVATVRQTPSRANGETLLSDV